jgi:photosystem II stability/assembly factor-like uncharacterized protein
LLLFFVQSTGHTQTAMPVRESSGNWQVRGVGGGGALFSPSINPANPNDIYIASDMGQIFHTTNGGASWDTVDFRQLMGGHNAKVQFTNNSQIMYSLSYAGGGDLRKVMKSIDAGKTWQPLPSDPTENETMTLIADYTNPNRLLICNYATIFLSTDGGATFAKRYEAPDKNAGVHLAGAFFDGNSIMIGTNRGLLVSTNGGSTDFTFAQPAGLPNNDIQSFSGAKENGTIRLWAVMATAGSLYGGIQGGDNNYLGVYRMDLPGNGNPQWVNISAGLPQGAKPYFVAVPLSDIDTVYLAGGSEETGSPTVFRSTTGGGNWQSIFQTPNNGNIFTGWSGDGGARDWSYGEYALGFAIAPFDPARLIFTDLGFAYLSENGGASWRALYVTPDSLNRAGGPIPAGRSYKSSGLENTGCWDLLWTSPTHIIGSCTDIRGVVSNDGGATWSFNYTGHEENSMYRAVLQPQTGIVFAAMSSVHDMYQSTHLSDESMDKGKGFVLYATPNQPDQWKLMHDFGATVVWVEADPTNPNRLYACVANSQTGGIYVTNNAQALGNSTWTKLSNPPRTEGHPFNLRVIDDGGGRTTLVATYSGRRTKTGFAPSSGLFVSSDGGQTWQDRSDPGMRYWTKDIVIDPHDRLHSTWYVAVFSGWGGAPNGLGGLYKTTNRGANWARINDLDRVNSVTVSPTNPNEAYLTTEVTGLWYSDNFQSPTPTFSQLSDYHFMHPLRVVYNPYNPREVWVTSFGGGLRVGVPGASR